MRDIFLITKDRITWDKCKETIISVFPNADGDDAFVFIGDYPKTIQIWFDDTESGDRLTDTQLDATDFLDETKKQIPFPNGYWMNVEFHLKKEAAKLVKALETLYPELFIIDDEDNVFSAKDYLIHVEVEGEE